MSKQDDELRKAIVNFRVMCDVALSERDDGFYTQQEYETAIQNRLNDVTQFISTHYIPKAEVLNLLRQYDTEVRGVTQSHLNPMHWTKRTKHRNELRDELIEALGLTSNPTDHLKICPNCKMGRHYDDRSLTGAFVCGCEDDCPNHPTPQSKETE